MACLSVPSNLLALAAAVSLALVVLRVRGASFAMASSLAAFALAALSPLGNLLLTPLEERFPEWAYPRQDLEGIIVIGGSYDSIRHAYLSTIVLEDDTEPLALIVDLARRYPEAKIIVSGGGPFAHKATEASIMRQYFVSFGIAPERIVTEDASQTTAQNAQNAAELLRPSASSRWLLLTYGYHMPRAVGAFRKAGFNVSAFPVHLRTNGWNEMWTPDATGTENLRKLDLAAHEWLGLIYYKLKGYSDDWFAAPADMPTEAQPGLIPPRSPAAPSLVEEAQQ